MPENADKAAELLISLIDVTFDYKKKNFSKAFKVNSRGNQSLSERQYQILFMIEYLKIDTLTEMAYHLMLSNNGLSTTISKMAANGYVVKNFAQSSDGRKVKLSISESGREILNEFTDFIFGQFEDFYFSLNEEQQLDFSNGLKNLQCIYENNSL